MLLRWVVQNVEPAKNNGKKGPDLLRDINYAKYYGLGRGGGRCTGEKIKL